MKAKVFVTLKNGVLDPQGKAVEGALKHLGYDGVKGVRIGKLIEVEVEAASADDARVKLTEMSEKLLANTVIEDYTIEVEGGK